MQSRPWHRNVYKQLYVQVLAAILIGGLLGAFFPGLGAAMKPLGDGFIKLVKMVIAPIVFITVVVGIARMGDLKEVGRVGLKALAYFEVVTTVALLIGLVVANVFKPGAGMNAVATAIDPKSGQTYTQTAQQTGVVDYLLNIVPSTVVDAFARGDLLQVLLFSIVFGAALSRLGERGRPVVDLLDQFGQALFGVIGMVMKLAPIGAFGGMAFAIGQYGFGTLFSLGKLMAGLYTTSFLFIVVVLGALALFSGANLWSLLRYFKEELLIVLGTSTVEPVLPRTMAKLEKAGVARPVVGLVLPAGYSFNLDGSMIYLTMAALFLAQAFNVDLSLGQQLTLLLVMMLTSKGFATVPGGGFVALAAALPVVGTIPVVGLALLVGVDRFMSECRAITSYIGNLVATLFIARWEGALDQERLRAVLAGEPVAGAVADVVAPPTPAELQPGFAHAVAEAA